MLSLHVVSLLFILYWLQLWGVELYKRIGTVVSLWQSLTSYQAAGTACASAYSSAGGSTQRPWSFISWIKASVARSISIPRFTTVWNSIQLSSSSHNCWDCERHYHEYNEVLILQMICQLLKDVLVLPSDLWKPSTFKNNHSTTSLNGKKSSWIKCSREIPNWAMKIHSVSW